MSSGCSDCIAPSFRNAACCITSQYVILTAAAAALITGIVLGVLTGLILGHVIAASWPIVEVCGVCCIATLLSSLGLICLNEVVRRRQNVTDN